MKKHITEPLKFCGEAKEEKETNHETQGRSHPCNDVEKVTKKASLKMPCSRTLMLDTLIIFLEMTCSDFSPAGILVTPHNALSSQSRSLHCPARYIF